METHSRKAHSSVISHNELANSYQVTGNTLRTWLRKIKGLQLEKRNKLYTPKQQKIIYDHLGNPFE